VMQRAIGDRQVGAIGLGGAAWSLGTNRDDVAAESLLTSAIELGVSYIDTAAAYTTADASSHNERLIARVLARAPHPVVVGTKGGHFREGNRWPVDGRPAAIRANCEASLRALGVNQLDLYFLHKPDPAVPFADSVGALEELRLEGKVRFTGVSNVSADQVDEALAITPLAAIQNNFSPFRINDLELMRRCTKAQLAYMIYSPLGGPQRPRNLRQALPNASRWADERACSIESVILAWELWVSPAAIPIVGASRIDTLRDSLSSTELEVDEILFDAISKDLAIS